MKKFLSIFLAVAFVFSAMCMSVLADKTYTDTEPENLTTPGNYAVVGRQGDGDSIVNGDENISDSNVKNNKAQITVNFNDNKEGGDTTIHNRYAVDITYGSLIIDLTNITKVDVPENQAAPKIEFVWDVNKHMYVPYDSETEEVATLEENSTYEIVINEAFYLTNHSDLEIYYAPEVEVNADYTSILQLKIRSTGAKPIDPTTDGVTDGDEPGTFMIQRATAGTYDVDETKATNGEATEGIRHAIVALPFNGTGTQAEWIAVINALSEALDEDAIANGAVIGTLTITITGSTTEDEKLYNATATDGGTTEGSSSESTDTESTNP